MNQHCKFDVASALSGVRLLVVEDEFVISLDLKSVLTDAGAEIVCVCRSVEDALALADEDDLGAAVLDFRLGRKTVAPVAQQLASRGVPFVFYTGQIETDPIRGEWPECKIISKPARPRTIVNAIAEVINEKSATAAGNVQPYVPF